MKQILHTKLADALAQDFPELTPREATITYPISKVRAIIGMRRSGKTSFLYQCLRERLLAGQAREALLYFNFEDERLPNLQASELGTLVEEYYRLHPSLRKKQTVTFCFDEIQLVKDWEKFVRRLLDEENVEIFISGSSAKMLSREVATSMRGRAMETWITPFSFREFLRHHGTDIPDNVDIISSTQQTQLRHAFDKYLEYGGFPEAQEMQARDRIRLLQSYVDAVLLKDIIERYELKNITALRSLVRRLLSNCSTPCSISKIYNDFRSQGIAVSKETLLDYLSYLQDSFLVAPFEIYARSANKRQVNPRKIYLADHSLAKAFATTQQDLGHYLENIVACELQRESNTVDYYKTKSGYEIDFITSDHHGKQSLIQVAAILEDANTRQRELRALTEAAEELPHADLLLLSLSEEATIDAGDRRKIHILPVWRWLLNLAR